MQGLLKGDISFLKGGILSERGVKNWLQTEREHRPLGERTVCY